MYKRQNIIHADKDQLIIPFNLDWLVKYQHLYSLGAGPYSPPFSLASLYIYNHENNMFINQLHYQVKQPLNTQNELIFNAIRPRNDFTLTKSIDIYRSRTPVLYLWFTDPLTPLVYNPEKPWVIPFETQPDSDGKQLDLSREYVQASPLWRYHSSWPDVKPPSPEIQNTTA